MLRPIYLQPGDKVALIAPSGYTTEDAIKQAVELLEDWQLNPVESFHLRKRHGLLAGTAWERLEDYQQALDDEEIRAIWCMNGYYGALQIVEEADYSIFQGNPKWVIGMDDITVLHSKLYSFGIESMHAFMPNRLGQTAQDAMTQLRDFLFGRVSSYSIPVHPLNREGVSEADLVGGMLSWIQDLHVTRLGNEMLDTVLFIEDLGENKYNIDKVIRCLRYGNKWQYLKGLVVGTFGSQTERDWQEEVYRLIRNAVEDYDFPVCFGFPAGHVAENYPVILGANVELSVNSETCELRFI